ncbi:MAG TPA: c-type cytochrome [Candidatus Acidoferrum sp.]|nr:c-type cytochrome [Candidatus Acidoferrum sp.]
MVIRFIFTAVVSAALLGWFVRPCVAQEQTVAKDQVATSNPPSSAELYKKHCAACHGDDLRGAGPFPPPYRTPPDLTTLARRHGGKFPYAYVLKVTRNGVELPAHGPAEMPVWGSDFEAAGQLDKTQVTLRIKSLTNYLKLQQR